MNYTMKCLPITVAAQTGASSVSQVKCPNFSEGQRHNIEITNCTDYNPCIKTMRRLNYQIACHACTLCSTLRKGIKRSHAKARFKKHVKEELT